MFKRLIEWLSRRRCRHVFVQIDSWREKSGNISYPVRLYECQICGIRVKSGGRQDQN